MRIYVTKEDIKNGKKKISNFCPVALSLKRRFPKRTIHVGISICCIGKFKRIELPNKASNFICKFDQDISTEPFSFNLKVE